MKVLVTGAAGFIGSFVLQALQAQGFEVVALDNLSMGKQEQVLEGIPFYQTDITERGLESIFKSEKPDYVIHLAAQTSVMESISNPTEDGHINILGTLNMLRHSQKYGVRKFVLASSAAVYGDPSQLPVKEDASLIPLSFYALSKISAERYVRLFESMFGLRSCILRFSNVFGPNHTGGVITSMISRLMDGNVPIIFDGSQTRDFVYVKDVATACVNAMKSDSTGIFNISSSTEISINETYQTISSLMNVDVKPIFKPSREGEIKRSMLLNTKALTLLEWMPSYSFKEGLKETVDYYRMSKTVKGPEEVIVVS